MRKVIRYRAQATSVAGFLQVLAANYLPSRYVFYFQGQLQPHMDAREIDIKLIARYEIAISKDARYWRRSHGEAVVHLLRYRLFYLLLASKGHHCFYEQEVNIKDARTSPIHFGDYLVSFLDGHSCVRLAPEIERRLRRSFLGLACTRSAAALARDFHDLPYLPYKPVVDQEEKILHLVNAKRKRAGKAPVSKTCLRKRRSPVRPFDWADADYDPSAEDYAASPSVGAVPPLAGNLSSRRD